MRARMPTTADTRRVFAKPESVWYLRHASALARWPVLTEPWALRVEHMRVEAEAPGRREGPSPAGR